MSESDASSIVPAPWNLFGDAYVLAVWRSRDHRAREQFVAPQRGRAREIGFMMFIRYSDSDVGPYDELLWLPAWGVRFGNEWHHSVTHIFVSTTSSVESGRANWGIPKERADFEVTAKGPLVERVRVTTAGHFVASFELCSYRASLPVNTGLLPACARTLVQELDHRRFRLAPSASGRLHLTRWRELSIDPARFPDVTCGLRIASFSLRGMRMQFPAADVNSID